MGQNQKRELPKESVVDTSPKRRKSNPFQEGVNDRIKNARTRWGDKNTAPSRSVPRTSHKATLPIINGTQQTPPSSIISYVDSVGTPWVSVGDDTAALVDLHTPPNQPRNGSQLQTPLTISSIGSVSHIDSAGRSLQMLEAESGVTVNVDVSNGEYVLKIKRKRSISSSTVENKVEETQQMAQTAGMLFLQAEVLRNTGEQLLAQTQYEASASLQCMLGNSLPRNIEFTDQ